MATSLQLKSFQLFQVCRTHWCFQGSLWAQAIVSFYQASPRSISSYLLCSLPRWKPSRLQTCYCWSLVNEKKLYKKRRGGLSPSLATLLCKSSNFERKKVWCVYVYDGILLRHKEKWNNAICSHMDGTRDYHPKWSKSERERQIPYDTTYMWNPKYDTNKSIYKTEWWT